MAAFTTTPHPTPELIDAFSRGDLSESDALGVEAHLAWCADCQQTLELSDSADPLFDVLRRIGPTLPEPTLASSCPAWPSGYEILELIGRGGMGVVFRARQLGLSRIVALKQVREGMDSAPQAIDRFRAEVEAVARLEHPQIVRILDVGQRDGVPFYAMEYLPGGSLADRLARGPLPPVEAAALTEALARGIDHAHRAGVVHRDLKPANVLLAGDGTPKVADFGLARLLDDTTGRTRTGALLGTPGYMAPEQADSRAEEVGPRADVYALGAILYESLTGRPPFHAASPLETLDQARTLDPTPPRQLQPGISRDLETICLKCLEKEPRRRYPTAEALADDLARFRDGAPILARPVGPPERMAKWARRSPWRAALAALALLTAAGGVAGVIVHEARLREQVARTKAAAADARAERLRADANYREARDVIRKMTARFQDVRFSGSPRLHELYQEQAEDALGFYQAILERQSATSDPAVRLDTARALIEAATLQIALGQSDAAEENLTRALELTRALAGPLGESSELLGHRLQAANKLALLWSEHKLEPAVEVQTEAVALARRLLEREPDSPERRDNLAWCEHNLASTYLIGNRPNEAEPPLRRAVAIREDLIAAHPDREEFRIELAESLANLALLDAGRGRHHPADAEFRRADEFLRGVSENSAITRRILLSRADVMLNWGNLGLATGRLNEAQERYDRGVSLAEQALALEPNLRRARRDVLKLHGARALLLGTLGRHDDAVNDWARVVEMADDAERPSFGAARLLAMARSGDHARAAREAQPLRNAAGTPTPPEHMYNLACVFALCSEAARDDARVEPFARACLVATYRASALNLLRLSAEAGYFRDPAHVAFARADADLASLADLEVFARVLGAGEPTGLETADGAR